MNKFFTIVISIALLSFFGYFYLYPSYTEWQDDLTRLEEVQNKLATRNEYFEGLKDLNEKLSNYEAGLGKIESAIPNHFSAPKLYNYLQQKGAQGGMIVQEISSSKVKREQEEPSTNNNGTTTEESSRPQIEERMISVKLAGSYPNFKEFIKELEKSARIFSIETVSIEAPKGPDEEEQEQAEGEEQESSQTFPFSIQLKVYSN